MGNDWLFYPIGREKRLSVMRYLINLQGALNHFQTTTFSLSLLCIIVSNSLKPFSSIFSLFIPVIKMRRLFFSDASAIMIRSLVTFSDLLVDFTDFIRSCWDTSRGEKNWPRTSQTDDNSRKTIWTVDVFVLENPKVTQRKVCKNEPTRCDCFMQQKPPVWHLTVGEMSFRYVKRYFDFSGPSLML